MKEESLILKEILEAREKRVKLQKELTNIFRTTLISFTLNIPGAQKNCADFKKVHELGDSLLEEELKKQNIKIIHKVVNSTAAGIEAFLNVDEDVMLIKRITVSIEEKHKLGRLFDMDVLSKNGELISRSQLGLPERKCLLCNDSAKICGRSRKHSVEDLLNKIRKLVCEAIE